MAEAGTLEQAMQLVRTAAEAARATRESAIAAAAAAAAEAAQEHMHAATRHCYFQRAELQLLLRQLRFCSSELACTLLQQT